MPSQTGDRESRGTAARFRKAFAGMLRSAPGSKDADATGMRRQESAPLLLEISDSGIGIAAETADKLFQPFVQADTSTTRKYGGTGLGLPVVAKLVKIMKGSLWLLARPGQGTTFLLAIPCVAAEPDASLAAGGMAPRRRSKPPVFARPLGSMRGGGSRGSNTAMSRQGSGTSGSTGPPLSAGAKAAIGLRPDSPSETGGSHEDLSSNGSVLGGLPGAGGRGSRTQPKHFYSRAESLASINEVEEQPHAIVVADDSLTAAAYANTLASAGATLIATSTVSGDRMNRDLRKLAACGCGAFATGESQRHGASASPRLSSLLVQLQALDAQDRARLDSMVVRSDDLPPLASIFVVVDARVALRDETEAFALQEIASRCRVVLVSPPGVSSMSSQLGLSRATLEAVVTAPLRGERMTSILNRPEQPKADQPAPRVSSAEGPVPLLSPASAVVPDAAPSPDTGATGKKRRRVVKKKKKMQREQEQGLAQDSSSTSRADAPQQHGAESLPGQVAGDG